MSALLTDRIDGFMGGMRNFEPLAIKFAGKSPRVFYPEEYGFPRYEELIFITRKDKIHDPDLAKFVYALKESVFYLKKNPNKTWEKFVISHPEMNNDLNKEAWFITIPYFVNNPAELNKKRYQDFTWFLWKKGMIKYFPKIEEYAL